MNIYANHTVASLKAFLLHLVFCSGFLWGWKGRNTSCSGYRYLQFSTSENRKRSQLQSSVPMPFLVDSPRCCHLGGTVSSSSLCRCRGGGTASSNRSCCSGPASLWRWPASWSPGPPAATDSGRCPGGTIRRHLHKRWHLLHIKKLDPSGFAAQTNQ